MTVPEAQEQIEALTLTLASRVYSPKQRAVVEAKIARCHRVIQRELQRAHDSLASVSTTLLAISDTSVLTRQQATAIVAAVHLIRGATTEQLAAALPAAIHDSSTDGTSQTPNKFPELSTIARTLLKLESQGLRFEERTALHTALHLMKLADKPQIHRSMRQSQAFTDGLGTKNMLSRLKEIYTACRPQPKRLLVGKNGSTKSTSLEPCTTTRSSR
jgi:hypothetical protein